MSCVFTINQGKHAKSVTLSRLALEWALASFHLGDSAPNDAVLLACGVHPSDYRRLIAVPTFGVHFFSPVRGLEPQIQYTSKTLEVDEDTARWAFSFVSDTILHWQERGLSPAIPGKYTKAAARIGWVASIMDNIYERENPNPLASSDGSFV